LQRQYVDVLTLSLGAAICGDRQKGQLVGAAGGSADFAFKYHTLREEIGGCGSAGARPRGRRSRGIGADLVVRPPIEPEAREVGQSKPEQRLDLLEGQDHRVREPVI
jgi:hypothetical protein